MKDEIYCRCVPTTCVFLVLMFMGFLPKLMADTGEEKSADVAKPSKQHVAEVYGKVPLAVEANTGQTTDQVKFLSRGPGYRLFLNRDGEAVVMLDAEATKITPGQKGESLAATVKRQSKSAPRSIFRMKLVNADMTSQSEGLDSAAEV